MLLDNQTGGSHKDVALSYQEMLICKHVLHTTGWQEKEINLQMNYTCLQVYLKIESIFPFFLAPSLHQIRADAQEMNTESLDIECWKIYCCLFLQQQLVASYEAANAIKCVIGLFFVKFNTPAENCAQGMCCIMSLQRVRIFEYVA